MVAESIPARRRGRLLFTLLAAALATALAAPGTSIAAEEDEAAGTVSLVVAVSSTPIVNPGQPLSLGVTVSNDTDTSIAAGEIAVSVDSGVIESRSDLAAWIDEGAGDAGSIVGRTPSPSIPAGGTATITLTVPAEATLLTDSPAGVHRVSATLEGSDTEASGRTTLTYDDGTLGGAVDLALATPLTVPPQSRGLISADDLATWTDGFGLLSRQLDAVYGRPVAIAIDPMILASIRVLGDEAPESAIAWLERLASAPNEIFPLSYADADIAVQSQAGIPTPLVPSTFEDVLNPDRFSDPLPGGGATPEPTATPAPEDDGAEATVPTTEELVAWDYTRTDLVWPGAGTVALPDLDYFDRAGLTTAILGSANVEPVDGPTPNAASSLGGSTAVVTDAAVTAALQRAQEATNETDWAAANARLVAELGLIATEGRAPTVLGLFTRSTTPTPNRVEATLAIIDGMATNRPATLSQAIGAPPETRTFIDAGESTERVAAVSRLMSMGESLTEFSSALTNPVLLTAPESRSTLALLGVGWLSDTEGWNTAMSAHESSSRATLSSVQVLPSSQINVWASQTEIPVTVENTSPYDVAVVIDLNPSNPRLVVDDTVTASVGPKSRTVVKVPVEARIGNGDVILDTSLTSPTGVPIGTTVRIPANVQAEWEGIGAVVIASIVFIVFGLGVWRTIRRRRRERDAPDESATETDDAENDTPRVDTTDV
ncbi:DUF6049 family protein [Agromyces atrinae]|uniref:DUF6049 family protein n=1 Tax=Agromyces atrinae TaxID=592376 RepID=UPI001F5A7FBA|nr:DUF6049 family protein [Agromyces atrinae]MCI2956809.1 DUF6049 family protein [Agromyces atrinae]